MPAERLPRRAALRQGSSRMLRIAAPYCVGQRGTTAWRGSGGVAVAGRRPRRSRSSPRRGGRFTSAVNTNIRSHRSICRSTRPWRRRSWPGRCDCLSRALPGPKVPGRPSLVKRGWVVMSRRSVSASRRLQGCAVGGVVQVADHGDEAFPGGDQASDRSRAGRGVRDLTRRPLDRRGPARWHPGCRRRSRRETPRSTPEPAAAARR